MIKLKIYNQNRSYRKYCWVDYFVIRLHWAVLFFNFVKDNVLTCLYITLATL